VLRNLSNKLSGKREGSPLDRDDDPRDECNPRSTGLRTRATWWRTTASWWALPSGRHSPERTRRPDARA